MIVNPSSSGGGGSSGSKAIEFSNTEWTASGSVYTLTIPNTVHGMKNGDFAYMVYHLVDGKYVDDTWAAFSTEVRYDTSSQVITLKYKTAYSGKIVLVA